MVRNSLSALRLVFLDPLEAGVDLAETLLGCGLQIA